MSETLVLNVARHRLQRFVEQNSKRDRQASELRLIEELLKAGIEAFHWIADAERFLVEAGRSGAAVVDASAADAISQLYVDWLASSKVVQTSLVAAEERGLHPSNLAEFRSVEQTAQQCAARDAIIRASAQPLFSDAPPGGATAAGAVNISLSRLDQHR